MRFSNYYCKLPHFSCSLLSRVQEEIKITGITVFVNPYTEPDEEEEKEKAKDEKNADDEENVSFKSFDMRILAFFGFYFLSSNNHVGNLCFSFCSG